MSMFDNIVFDEFTLLEGEQAEAYKKRKEEEKLIKNSKDREYNSYLGRGGKTTGVVYSDKNPSKADRFTRERRNQEKQDLDRNINSIKKVLKHQADNNKKYSDSDFNAAKDAVNRHERRHPKNESGFFSEIDFI